MLLIIACARMIITRKGAGEPVGRRVPVAPPCFRLKLIEVFCQPLNSFLFITPQLIAEKCDVRHSSCGIHIVSYLGSASGVERDQITQPCTLNMHEQHRIGQAMPRCNSASRKRLYPSCRSDVLNLTSQSSHPPSPVPNLRCVFYSTKKTGAWV